MATRKVQWELPTTYTDGTAIADKSAIVTHIFVDGVEVGVSSPGATEWVGEVPSSPGQTLVFTAACELAGQMSAQAEGVAFQIPFLVPNPPTGLRIS